MASGDFIYQHDQVGTLTAGQVTSLGGLLGVLWSGPLADLNYVQFARQSDGTVSYQLRGQKTVAPGAVPVVANAAILIIGKVP